MMRPTTKRVLTALLTAAVVGTGVTAMASPPPPNAQQQERRTDAPESYRYLKARIYTAPGIGTVAVGAPDPRHIMVQRLDEASGTWSKPQVLFLGLGGVTCGNISGRASRGGVVLLLECDRSYSEDQAPAHSIAAVSRGLRSWNTQVLPGEAYRVPAISPDGSYAAWLAGGPGSFVPWSSTDGVFSELRSTTYDGSNGGETVVVTDDGTVSVIGPESAGEACAIGVHERTLDGQLSSSRVEGVDPGCTEGSLENRGAFEVVGSQYDRASRYTIRREDGSSPWVLTRRAPADAPGLVDYRGGPRRVIFTSYSDVPGQPLVAFGSPDRRRVYVQRYDETIQAWAPRELAYDHGFPGCASDGNLRRQRLKVHAVSLHCYPVKRAGGDYPPYTNGYQVAPPSRVRMLVSSDGVTWRVVDIAGRPVGTSADRTLLTAPGARSTTVVSTDGIRVLPMRAPARCGFVFPVAGDRVLRLHGGQGAGWPRVLQRRDNTGWRTIQRVALPREGTCARVRGLNDTSPTTYLLNGAGKQIALRVVRKHGAWRVIRPRGY